MIFVDYNGSIDPNTGASHVGHRVIQSPEKGSTFAVILSPGAQGIDQAAWEAIRGNHVIGWDEELKACGGWLVDEGQLKFLPTKGKDGTSIDWAKVPKASLLGSDGLISRTIHPAVLESLRVYAVERTKGRGGESWAKIVDAVTKHLEDVVTGFDGKPTDVPTAQSRFKQVIGA